MKKFAKAVTGITSFGLLVGAMGGFENDLLTGQEFLLRYFMLLTIFILVTKEEKKDIPIRKPTEEERSLIRKKKLCSYDWLIESENEKKLVIVSKDGRRTRNIYKEESKCY